VARSVVPGRRSATWRIGAAIVCLLAAGSQALAQSANVQRGRQFARAKCAQCHAIDKVGRSKLPAALPLRDLHKHYPVEALEEPLAEGIITGHPSMPEFRLDPDQIGDFIAFLKSLE
jgi:mono/diheme cytochrome c family protein